MERHSREKGLERQLVSGGGLISGAGLIVGLIGFAFLVLLAAQPAGTVHGDHVPSGWDSVHQESGNNVNGCTSEASMPPDTPFTNDVAESGDNPPAGAGSNGPVSWVINSDRTAITSWTSSVPVAGVIVKGGPSAFTYVYSPAALSDSGAFLHAPENPGGNIPTISHILFCNNDETPPEPSDPTLQLVKECVNGSGETFDFLVDELLNGEDEVNGLGCGLSSGVIPLAADEDYEVTEDLPLPEGWSFTGADCIGVTDAAIPNGRSFTPSEGDIIICTFINTLEEEEDPGSIEACKDAEGLVAGDEFDFSFDGDNFDLVDGDCELFDGLGADEYILVELDDANLVDVDCDIVDNGPGGNDSDIDIDGSTVTIDLAVDEHISCLFTNDEEAPPVSTSTPIIVPTATPTGVPTATPTDIPTATPTAEPTEQVGGVVATPPVQELPSTGSGGGASRTVNMLLALGLVLVGGSLLASGRILSARGR